MFWLFKRKKVADKKAMTPCVCDNGNEAVPDTYSLQDFGSSSDSSPFSSRLTLEGGGKRGGYRRLQGEEPPPPPQPTPPQPEENSSGSETESGSSDSGSKDYFAGFTDTDDEEEELTCNVCERSFNTVRRLEQHQQRKRHYGCSICDSIFPALMALEAHKEALDHWSDYELRVRRCHEEPITDSEEEELEEHEVYSSAPGRRDGLRRLLL